MFRHFVHSRAVSVAVFLCDAEVQSEPLKMTQQIESAMARRRDSAQTQPTQTQHRQHHSASMAQTQRKQRADFPDFNERRADENDDKGDIRLRERGVEEMSAQIGLWEWRR